MQGDDRATCSVRSAPEGPWRRGAFEALDERVEDASVGRMLRELERAVRVDDA